MSPGTMWYQGIFYSIENFQLCGWRCSKEHPTHLSIRKNRADALLRLLTQPLFAH